MTSRNQELCRNWYDSRIAKGRDSFDKFYFHWQEAMGGIDFRDRTVLEVGCGQGAVSLYLAACSGARRVVALDEAAGEGAPVGVNEVLKEAKATFALQNLMVLDADIMKNDFSQESFDVIIGNNALHHVVTPGLIRRDAETRRRYIEMFSELKRLLRRNGVLVIVEYSRCCFWRWSPYKWKYGHIDWELHPTRAEWLSVIRESGLRIIRWQYSVPYAVRRLRALFATPVAQFLLYPRFVIEASRT